MVVRPALMALLAFAALIAGCLNGAGSTPSDPSAAAAPTGAGAGTASGHGSPTRDETGVSVRQQGTQFIAEKTITLANDFGGASHSTIGLEILNGAIDIHSGGNGGYTLVAKLNGQGLTEAQARDALGRLRFANHDDLSGTTLEVSAKVDQTGVSLPTPESAGASFAFTVPAEPGHTLAADTSNGAIVVTGLHGPSATLGSSNGAVTVSGAFAKVVADTSNAAVDLSGTFNDVMAGTSNGAMTASVRAAESGKLVFSSSNGAIAVTLQAGSDRGFDAKGDTSNARVSIDLGAGSQSSGGDSAAAMTPGYAGKAVKVEVQADTSNAPITITAR